MAYASSGKEFPRKVNAATMHAVGLAHCLGESFASGEGLQDSLNDDPCMLFQTDEIDGLLQSINKSRDARYEIVLGTLLKMYSTANGFYPMLKKAGKQRAETIEQPCLVIYPCEAAPFLRLNWPRSTLVNRASPSDRNAKLTMPAICRRAA